MQAATYVPRSPRRATRLRAVVDDGALHAVGSVRDMSTSGLFLAGASLAVGRRVAVVPLVGDLDGERLPAEVARIADGGVALRFLGLDADHRQRLRRMVSGDSGGATALAPRPPPGAGRASAMPELPADAPMVLLTDDGEAPPLLLTQVDDSTEQLIEELRARCAVLGDENTRLQRDAAAIGARLSLALALKSRLHDENAEHFDTIADMDRIQEALVKRIQVLEELLRRALLTGWEE